MYPIACGCESSDEVEKSPSVDFWPDSEQPDRVPLFEAEIEIPIKEALLGREITTAEDDVEFFIRAGYDFVPVVPPFFTPRMMRQAEGDESSWIKGSEGLIKTMEDIEKFHGLTRMR